MSIEHYAQLEFLYADTEERAPSPFPTFASAPPAAAAPEMAADIAATPWEPATAAAAFQSIQDRPSALARLVGAGNTGRPPKSQAFPWNDPAVQERLYQLMGVCDAGQMTQAVRGRQHTAPHSRTRLCTVRLDTGRAAPACLRVQGRLCLPRRRPAAHQPSAPLPHTCRRRRPPRSCAKSSATTASATPLCLAALPSK